MKDTHTKFGIPKLIQSPDSGQNSDRVLFNFQISAQNTYKSKLP